MRAVIFANGQLSDPQAESARLRPDDWILAADGGAAHARGLGITPHVLIGDLDSLSAGEQARLEAAGCAVLVFPARKDETDLELALHHALAGPQAVTEVLVLGALGARWDQTVANVMLLAKPEFRGRAIRLVDGGQELQLAPARLSGGPGDTVSLIPLTGDARGVTTHGLDYPLQDGTLPFGATLGVSNEMTGAAAEVRVREGLVLVVHIRR